MLIILSAVFWCYQFGNKLCCPVFHCLCFFNLFFRPSWHATTMLLKFMSMILCNRKRVWKSFIQYVYLELCVCFIWCLRNICIFQERIWTCQSHQTRGVHRVKSIVLRQQVKYENIKHKYYHAEYATIWI